MRFKGKPTKSLWSFIFLAMATISALVLAVDHLLPRLLLHSLNGNAASIGIIGGADGPTAVFVTTSPGNTWTQLIPWLTLLMGTAGFLLLRKRKTQNNKKEGEA